MKIIFFVLFFAVSLSLSAQELIVVTGGGLSKTDSIVKGNYGFAQARLMINLSPGFRVGPYIGYTQYSSTELTVTPNPFLLGKELSYGLSLDSYGHLSYAYAYYVWVNTGLKNVTDKYQDKDFTSTTSTKEIFVSGGFIVTDDWLGWFGNNRLMWEYQRPLNATVEAKWKGQDVIGVKPYDKEALRLFIESGVKRFGGEKVNIEPLIHIGYGKDFGRQQDYFEVGGGVDAGIFKEYYRDILKVKVFYREDFGGKNGTVCGEIVFNPTSLIQAIKK